mgnify:CR=1 FL=1
MDWSESPTTVIQAGPDLPALGAPGMAFSPVSTPASSRTSTYWAWLVS